MSTVCMTNLQPKVNHWSHTLGNSSGLLCFCFQSLVCIQITLDKQAQLTLCRQLCRSLFFSHGKHPLQQSHQEQKIFLNTSLLTPYCGPHTLKSPDCHYTSQEKNSYCSSSMQQAPGQTENYLCNKPDHQTCTARFYLHPEIILHFYTCCH